MYEEHDRAKGIESLNTKVCKRLFGIWREREREIQFIAQMHQASIQWKMDGVMCGYLITVAVMALRLIMLLDVGKMNVKPGRK